MEEKKTKPHLFNLNFDPQLSGRLGRRRLLFLKFKYSTELVFRELI
jgi:hypothetical protein